MEVSLALASRIDVIPVLVDRAEMPSAADLPSDLAKLASLNAFELSNRRFRTDADELAATLKLYLKENWRFNQKIPVGLRAQGDRIITPLQHAFKQVTGKSTPAVREVSVTRTTFYLVTEKSGSAKHPGSVLRRVETELSTAEGVISRHATDEIFSRNLTWEPSTQLSDAERGDTSIDVTEITAEEADLLMGRIVKFGYPGDR